MVDERTYASYEKETLAEYFSVDEEKVKLVVFPKQKTEIVYPGGPKEVIKETIIKVYSDGRVVDEYIFSGFNLNPWVLSKIEELVSQGVGSKDISDELDYTIDELNDSNKRKLDYGHFTPRTFEEEHILEVF